MEHPPAADAEFLETMPQPDLIAELGEQQISMMGYTRTISELVNMCPVDLSDRVNSPDQLDAANSFLIVAMNKCGAEIEPKYADLFASVLAAKGMEPKFIVREFDTPRAEPKAQPNTTKEVISKLANTEQSAQKLSRQVEHAVEEALAENTVQTVDTAVAMAPQDIAEIVALRELTELPKIEVKALPDVPEAIVVAEKPGVQLVEVTEVPYKPIEAIEFAPTVSEKVNIELPAVRDIQPEVEFHEAVLSDALQAEGELDTVPFAAEFKDVILESYDTETIVPLQAEAGYIGPVEAVETIANFSAALERLIENDEEKMWYSFATDPESFDPNEIEPANPVLILVRDSLRDIAPENQASVAESLEAVTATVALIHELHDLQEPGQDVAPELIEAYATLRSVCTELLVELGIEPEEEMLSQLLVVLLQADFAITAPEPTGTVFDLRYDGTREAMTEDDAVHLGSVQNLRSTWQRAFGHVALVPFGLSDKIAA